MSASRGQRGHRGGRIHSQQRETNDTAPTVGNDLALPADLAERYNETASFAHNDKTRQDYHNRIKRIITFWKENDPTYYAVGVCKVSEADLADATKYHFGKTEDIVYEGLNESFVLHFLVCNKHKDDGSKLKSLQDLRKYKDAIMWGSKMAGVLLPVKFFEMFDQFLGGYKKEFNKEKKKGNVDQTDADPISISLYRLLLKYAIDSNNIFVWFWTLAQWNCMARCASIDPLGFHNVKLGVDSLVVKYDDSKADKAGEKLSEKNIFANPFQWQECFWTGMGVWLALREGEGQTGDCFFLHNGLLEGNASKKYAEQLVGMIQPHLTTVGNHINIKKFNPYGTRKGSATHAVSGTTMPPSIPSIARRGEWSIGSVLDVYWHFGSVGDQYLGRILAGLDPMSPNFDVLPPHWNISDPMSNEFVKRGMNLTYKNFMENKPAYTALILRLFACVVFHSDALIATMASHSGHDFTKVAILHDRALLKELKSLVTLERTAGVIEASTGIPPHVTHARQLEKLLEQTGTLMTNMDHQNGTLVASMVKTLEDRGRSHYKPSPHTNSREA